MNLRGRIVSLLQIEDALLFIWLVVVTPLLQRVLGGALTGINLENLDRNLPNATWLGVTFVISTILAGLCLLTRAPDEDATWGPISGTPFGYAHLPMLASTSLMLFFGLQLLGFGDAAVSALCPVFILFGVVFFLYSRMPVIGYGLRRVLMTPFIILTATLFSSSIDPLFSNLNPETLQQILQTDTGRFEVELLTGGVLIYYLMFVFAPRQIAGRAGGWLEWGARFALYLVGLILNVRLLQGF